MANEEVKVNARKVTVEDLRKWGNYEGDDKKGTFTPEGSGEPVDVSFTGKGHVRHTCSKLLTMLQGQGHITGYTPPQKGPGTQGRKPRKGKAGNADPTREAYWEDHFAKYQTAQSVADGADSIRKLIDVAVDKRRAAIEKADTEKQKVRKILQSVSLSRAEIIAIIRKTKARP